MIKYVVPFAIVAIYVILSFLPAKAQEMCVSYDEVTSAITEKLGKFEKIKLDRELFLEYLKFVYTPGTEEYIEKLKKSDLVGYELWVIGDAVVMIVPVKIDCMPRVIMIRYNIHEEILKLLGKPT